MGLKWWLGLLAFWTPILATAWFDVAEYRSPPVDTEKISALIAQHKIEERQRCIGAVRKMVPSLPKEAQQRAGELLAKCASDQ